MVVRGRRREAGRRGLGLARVAWIVGIVAVGAYGAGATNLIQTVLGSSPQAGAPQTVVLASADLSPLAAFSDINRDIKSDRIAVRAPIGAGVIETAALFAPATTLPGSSFVRPSAEAPSPAASAQPAPLVVAALPKPTTAAAVSSVVKVDPVQTAAVKLPTERPPVPSVAAPAGAPVLLAYASPKEVETAAPFNAIISNKPKFVLDANIDAAHSWVNTPIPDNLKSAKETRCLAEAIYFEARGEPEKGQAAVAQVVLNRVKNPTYPKTICDVVYQNSSYINACQFSFACDGLPETISEPDAWATAMSIAKKELEDEKTMFLAEVGASTHYHATYVRPDWASEMTRMDKIGVHIFYKTINGGWN